MFVKNCWYVAAWDKEIPESGLFSRTIINMPLVFWRTGDGEIVALEDRCCHRGAPLSMGRQEGDDIRCMYHGLKFNRGGQCIEIPNQERIPPQAKVRTFPVVEQHRWVWVWMGDPAKADPALIPDTHWLDDPEWASLDGYIHLDVNQFLITDNLLDFSHLAFVHPTTLGGDEAYAKVQPKVERHERGVKITRWALNIDPPGFVQQTKGYPGKVDRWNIYDFLVPGLLLMDSGMAPAGTGAPEGNRVNAAEFRGCQAVTPETDDSTHYFFAHPNNFDHDEKVVRLIHETVAKAFEEDKAMIGAQKRMLELDPDFKMVPIAADAALAQYRWLVSKLVAEEAKEAKEAKDAVA